jgi:hypothetical protein
MRNPEDDLRDRVRAVLLSHWDPIGIREISAVQDEYDAYVAAISNLIVQKQSEAEIRDRLLAIETDLMGLQGDTNRASSVAAELVRMQRD